MLYPKQSVSWLSSFPSEVHSARWRGGIFVRGGQRTSDRKEICRSDMLVEVHKREEEFVLRSIQRLSIIRVSQDYRPVGSCSIPSEAAS